MIIMKIRKKKWTYSGYLEIKLIELTDGLEVEVTVKKELKITPGVLA